MGGAPAAASSGGCGAMAATDGSPSMAIEYTGPCGMGWSS